MRTETIRHIELNIGNPMSIPSVRKRYELVDKLVRQFFVCAEVNGETVNEFLEYATDDCDIRLDVKREVRRQRRVRAKEVMAI